VDLRYWDASAFIAVLNEEDERLQACIAVLNEAKRGELTIVTSAVTLTEVVKFDGERPIGREQAQVIRDFFMHEYISLRNADRKVCELAQDLIWDHSHLAYKDAIHVATAIRWHVPVIETYDDDFLKLNGMIGTPPVIVRHPFVDQGLLSLQPPDQGENDN